MTEIAQTQNLLEDNLSRYLDLLRQWVEVNSFTGNPQGVNRLGDLTAEAFAPLGFQAERIQAANPAYGKHLVLTREGSSGRKIGLISHLDTVFPPEEEEANDFHWRVEGDRIYGPGTNDVKGGTLTILMMLEALREFAPRAFDAITWVVLLNAAEERLADDFGELCQERLDDTALAALVFEAGAHIGHTFQLVTRRKGRASYRIQVEGRGAHAGSNHPEGANAIVQLAHTIQRVAALTDYDRQLTFNVGTVRGGTVINRVPHLAEAEVEMRTFDPQVFADGVRQMLALQNQVDVRSVLGNYPCRVQINVTAQSDPWPQNPGTQKLFRIWEQAAQSLGYQVLPEARGGLSDGNALWQHLPTIDGLGPHGLNGHCSERSPDGSKDQEFVAISSFVPKAVLNAVALRMLCEETNDDNRPQTTDG